MEFLEPVENVFPKVFRRVLSLHRDLRILWREAMVQGLDREAAEIRGLMKSLAGRVFRNGKVGMVVRGRYRGRTVSVFHIMFSPSGIEHFGIEGIRGWDPNDLEKVEFRIGGKRFQFDYISFGRKRNKWRIKRK